ncbi:4-phosphopantetheinyl transferase [Embleya scabrispora]|uniref:4-phosphopantetheinyl transferase n=1 Tax=Embleya scabrispora TaxID=159449 RepID=A0A1T3NY76_9ACTN|nr:4'-phosphopantetheinyl transferase superfamily protein [Embleya scabrispora]OPC81642.1 4-phosphopantetheinyl transferase [Embleya scabrispora]
MSADRGDCDRTRDRSGVEDGNGRERVEVWRIALDDEDDPDHCPASLEDLLDEDEKARAERGLLPGMRRRFVIAHAATRIVVGERLGRPPASLRFTRGRWGKPAVEGAGLHFSLSHSGGIALLALASRPVGVDVELARPDLDAERLARRFFGDEERELVARDGNGAFTRLWTRKEACVKAVGGRLTESMAIPVAHSARQAAVYSRSGSLTGPWRVADLPLPEGYAGSVALLGDAPFYVSTRMWYPMSPTETDGMRHRPGVK